MDQVVSIFHDLYRDSWGPRTDDILRAALLTLVGVPGMTLTEVPLLLTDPVSGGRWSGGSTTRWHSARSGAGTTACPTASARRPSGRS